MSTLTLSKHECYTADELEQILKHLSGVFTDVRLVDPVNCRRLSLSPDGNLVDEEPCYERWFICERCENCISERGLADGHTYEKVELLGDNVCWILAKPIIVIQNNGERFGCAIEVMTQTTVEEYGALLSANPEIDKTLLTQKGFYIDWSTRTYNRRYLDEGVYLGYLNLKPNIDLGLVMCKLENTEFLVDMFGSGEREVAARQLAQLLEHQCRSRDIIIRVDDDKFLVIMPSASSEDVHAAADRIRLTAPSVLSGESWGAEHISLSVGFAWTSTFDRTSAHVNELFREAEENAYLDRRGIRKSWDDLDGSWKFSVPDAIKAATPAHDANYPEEQPQTLADDPRMESASAIADILESAPETAADPLSIWFREFAKKDRGRPADTFRFPLPLMDRSFEPGTMKQFVESMGDRTTRVLANIELKYLNGDYLQAGKDAEALMGDRNDLAVRVAAGLFGALSNMATNHPVFARQAKDSTAMLCQKGILGSNDSKTRAVCAIVDSTIIMFFDEQRRAVAPISEALTDLPEGQRLFASFLIAHQKLTEGEYGNSLGIVNTALSYCTDIYPVPMIYLHIVAASDYMSLRRLKEAKQEFEKAWDLAKQDWVISPFVEHYVKLQGLLDACLKKTEPEAYRAISKAAQQFRSGWVGLVDSSEESEQIATLSASEMTIAGLARRGWSNREIAMHMQLSENTVKHRVSFIYQKLHINRRPDLARFRLL